MDPPPPIRVLDYELRSRQVSTRLPFRFGMTTLTRAPLLLLHLPIEVNGEVTHGFASDLLVPKWFDKDPSTSAAQDADALVRSADEACRDVAELGRQASVFHLWRELQAARVESLPVGASGRLVQGFGVSLVERAALDAAARAASMPFIELVGSGMSGFDPGAVHAELAGAAPGDALEPTPRSWVHVRHTVGLADAITPADGPEADRPGDGFPESLEEDVELYGLRYFKIKIAGDLEGDLERLARIHETLAPRVPDYAFTLDGNEQLESIADLERLLHALARTEQGRAMRKRLLYVEQPLGRAVTFDADRLEGIETLGVDLVIDEADDAIDAFRRALGCGYRGVSVKNCKGVFRALANRLLAHRCAGPSGRGSAFQSAEDLTNLPVVPLQQDLATVAALGLDHVERNGHHYFRGLHHLPPADQAAALEHHPDLYGQAGGRGEAALRIEDGRLHIASLQCAGYGVACPPDVDAWPETRLPETRTT